MITTAASLLHHSPGHDRSKRAIREHGGVVMVVVWIVASVIFGVFVTARYASVLEWPCVTPFPEPSRHRRVEPAAPE
jgi:hypothetical protein